MSVHVGCTGMPVGRARYVEALSAIELTFPQSALPNAATLRRWLETTPEGFAFSVVAPPALSRPPTTMPPGLSGSPSAYGGLRPTAENLALYARTAEVAATLRARVIVFATTPQVPPGPRGGDVIRRFFDAIGPGSDGVRYGWEPHGPWQDEEVTALCTELGLVRCVDPLRDPLPEGEVAYARLGPFAAMGRAFADDELESIAEALSGYAQAYCFFATERSFHDARRLRALCEP